MTVRISCRGEVKFHGDDGEFCHEDRRGERAACFAMLYQYQYSPHVLSTITALLNPGDEIVPHWSGGYGNSYVNNSTIMWLGEGGLRPVGYGERLYHDTLHLEVVRKGKRKYYFYVTDSVCPDITYSTPVHNWEGWDRRQIDSVTDACAVFELVTIEAVMGVCGMSPDQMRKYIRIWQSTDRRGVVSKEEAMKHREYATYHRVNFGVGCHPGR
jgi:hypothetical protein